MSRLLKLLLAGAFFVAVGLTLWWDRNPPAPGPTTRLEIEFSGGFAYVPTPTLNTLEVAYLNDVELKEDTDKNPSTPEAVVCRVDQIGTRMMVLRGEIIDSTPDPAPPDRTFDLDQAVIEFPALQSASLPLNFERKSWAPSPLKPTNPADEAQWANLQYVRSIKDQHPGTSIVPGWRSLVNGYIKLKGGTLTGRFPSDPTVQGTHFDFKLAGVSRGQVAVSDKTLYTVDVPSDKVELIFTSSAQNYKTLVIKPNQPGEAVRLRVRGLHSMSTLGLLADGQEITDACGFYSLLQPRPRKAEWLTVHYVAPAATPGGGQPSPGYFCDGNSF